MANRDSTYSHFYRVDAKSAFMEIVPFAFPIGKVQFNFCQYGNNNKMSKKLEIYMDFKEALAFANGILSGRIDRKIAEAQKTGKFEGKDVSAYTSYFTVMGGINFEHKPERLKVAKQTHPWLTGNYIARQFEVQVSTKYKYALTLKYGNGKKADNGLISMDGKQQEYVQIPISELDAIAMAREIEMNIQAYRTMWYIKFADKMFPNLECKLFEPDSTKAKQSNDTQQNNSRPSTPQNVQQANTSSQANAQDEQQNTVSNTTTATTPKSNEPAKPVTKNITFTNKDIANPLTLCKNSDTKFALKLKDNTAVLFESEHYASCKEWEDIKQSLTDTNIHTKITFEVEVKDNGYLYFRRLVSIRHEQQIRIKTTGKLLEKDNGFVVNSTCDKKSVEVVFENTNTSECSRWEELKTALLGKVGVTVSMNVFTEGNKAYFIGLPNAS